MSPPRQRSESPDPASSVLGDAQELIAETLFALRKQADEEGRNIEEADMDNVGNGTHVATRDLEKVSGSAEAVWDEAFLVTFDQNEAQNTLNWTKKRKWGVTAAISGTGFVRIMVSTV
ncbi:unnamed protein product [Aspergillus oryzae]|nr:unnamed protein product [Aspergillus oryzae]